MVYHFGGITLYSFIVFFLVLVIILKYKYKKSYMYLLFFSVMYLYLCNVIKLTQFPIYTDDLMREAFGGQNVWKEMNLIPFKNPAFMTSFLNIIMTIPLGFGLPFLIKATYKKIVVIGLLAGLLLESIQLIVALIVGFSFRVVDVNDIIFNFTGTLIGYLIFKLFRFYYNNILVKMKIENDYLSKYFK